MQNSFNLPLIKEIPPSPKSIIRSPKGSILLRPQQTYYLDLNKFLPSLKIFKEMKGPKLATSPSLYRSSISNNSMEQSVMKQSVRKSILSPKKNTKKSQCALQLALKHHHSEKESNDAYFPLDMLRQTNSGEYLSNIKKMDTMKSLTLPLSPESYYDEFHLKLYQSFMSSKSQKNQKPQEILRKLDENERVQLEGPPKTSFPFFIHTDYNDQALKVLINSHQGNFVTYVSFNELASLEKHNFIYDKSPFIIESEDIYQYGKIYLTVVASTYVKLSISYYFMKNTQVNSPVSHSPHGLSEHQEIVSPVKSQREKASLQYKVEDDEFYAGIEKKSSNLLDRNKEIAQNYYFLKPALHEKNKEDARLRQRRAMFKGDLLFLEESNDKIIKYLKKKNKKAENMQINYENQQRALYFFFQQTCSKLLFFSSLAAHLHNRFLMQKTMGVFLKFKEKKATRIQKLFRMFIRKFQVQNYYKRMVLSTGLVLRFESKTMQKRIKLKAKRILTSLFTDLKPLYKIFICTFKTMMKLIFIQNKVRHMKKSNYQRTLTLRRYWEDMIIEMSENETESIKSNLAKITENDKEKALKEFVNKKKKEFSVEIKKYITIKNSLDKQKSNAMKFLKMAKEKQTSDEDMEITEATKSSLLYRSISPTNLRKNPSKKTIKPIVVLSPKKIEEENTKKPDNNEKPSLENSNKLLEPAQQNIESFKDLGKGFARITKDKSRTVLQPMKNLELKPINTGAHGIKSYNNLSAPSSAKLDGIILDRPVFSYVPRKEEVREMILQALEEAMKR